MMVQKTGAVNLAQSPSKLLALTSQIVLGYNPLTPPNLLQSEFPQV